MKSMILSKAVVLAAPLAMLVGAQVANANLILNGDFSANASSFTTDNGYDNTGQSGNTNPLNPTDWTQILPGGPGVNGTDTKLNTFGPANPTELDGVKGGIVDYAFLQNFGGFEQTFSVTAGTTYKITYDAAARNQSTSIGTSKVPAGIVATVIDPNSTIIYQQTSNLTSGSQFYSNDNAGGNYFTTGTGNGLDFTALTSGVATLNFKDYGTSTDHTADFTNVVIAATPEPAALGLLGVGAVGLLLVRRRKA
jgi:hypothetical protein